MFRIICVFLFTVSLFSCNREVPPKQKTETQKTDIQEENNTDTAMTVEEAFSSALVEDIMGEPDDGDLEIYLEEQVYPLVSKSSKVTLDRVSSSIYLLSYDDNGIEKNLMIQKFYNPGKDEFVFEKRETQMDALKQFVK